MRLARESKRKVAGKCEGRKGWGDVPDKRDAILERIKAIRRKPKGQKRLTYVEVANQLNELVKNDDIYETITGKPWKGPMIQNFLLRYDKK